MSQPDLQAVPLLLLLEFAPDIQSDQAVIHVMQEYERMLDFL